MEQTSYDIYFTGKLEEGTDPQQAQARLAALFKTSPEKVSKLFDGKPQLLKRNIDKAGALKYKAALQKAGLIVAFKAHPQAGPAAKASPAVPDSPAIPEKTQTTNTAAAPVNSPAEAAGLSLAAAGSDVLREDERQVIEAREIDTSAIKLVSPFLEPEATPQETIEAPDTSAISVAAVGEDLLVDKPEQPPALPLNLDDISLAAPGSDLEQLASHEKPLNPDTSALSIAPAGSDIIENPPADNSPAAPNTEHIKLSE